jgi:hypothetical protein
MSVKYMLQWRRERERERASSEIHQIALATTVHLGGSGGMLPQKFWKFRLSENVSEAFW